MKRPPEFVPRDYVYTDETEWVAMTPAEPGGAFVGTRGKCACGKTVDTRFWADEGVTMWDDPCVCQECYPTLRALWSMRTREVTRDR